MPLRRLACMMKCWCVSVSARWWAWGAANGELGGAGGHASAAAANLRTAGSGRPAAGAKAGVMF